MSTCLPCCRAVLHDMNTTNKPAAACVCCCHQVGINASLDEDDDDAEEDVWALEAGRVKTRR